MESFLVGRTKHIISPDVGCELAGFAARKGVAVRVHDDLFVSVLVISKSDETVVLVSLDVIGISQDFTDTIRTAIYKSRKISPDRIILCATHTHCGPVTIQHFFNPDQDLNTEYLDLLRGKVIAAIEDAFDRREPGIIRAGMVSVKEISVNRRTESGLPVDDEAGVVLVTDLDGRTKSILVNYACHPTVLGPDTLDITKDFPHYLNQSLCERYGKDVVVLYCNGAEGDLNIGHKSALTAVGASSPSRTYEKAQAIGESLARQVILGLPTLVEEPPTISCERLLINLPLKTYKPLPTIQKRITGIEQELEHAEEKERSIEQPSMEVLQKRCDLLFARIDKYFASAHVMQHAAALPIELSVVRIGNTALVCVPGELFVETGLAIRKSSPFSRTLILGLANDYIGYIPTVDEAVRGGYEVVASQVLPVASTLIEEAVQDSFAKSYFATTATT